MSKKAPQARKRSDLWIARQSKIHGSGIFARKKIRKGTRIIEYVGERISKDEAQRRARKQLKRSEKSDDGAVYIFEINDEFDIDGNVDWNPARLINHSCDPNCETEQEGERIWIEAIRTIQKGEELTYNYGYDVDHYDEHPCLCGSENCVGYIVREDHWKKLKKRLKAQKKAKKAKKKKRKKKKK